MSAEHHVKIGSFLIRKIDVLINKSITSQHSFLVHIAVEVDKKRIEVDYVVSSL
jgi:hypothetical protein